MSGAQLRANGQPDLRLTTKVTDAGRVKTLNNLSSRYKPTLYNSTANPANANLGAPIAWINNEELLLLRVEIRWNTNNKQGAIDDLNLIRVNAGGLAPTSLSAASPERCVRDGALVQPALLADVGAGHAVDRRAPVQPAVVASARSDR